MSIYPVIMCGGAGTRLWPASRPSRPKQFLPLVQDISLFQTTVERVAPLAAQGSGELVVVAGLAHLDWLQSQLTARDVEATLLLEPSARDSGPAMAAAAAWIQARDPDAIAVFVASDHHIPDAAAFRTAVLEAAQAAETGRIVTLGVRPLSPSTAYGYIRPEPAEAEASVRPVGSFVEKPDGPKAREYFENGYLWNSGNFIARVDVFMNELATHAPEMAAAATAAVTEARSAGGTVYLGTTFNDATKLSIDYAVMEPTRLASVLPVDFGWSDLGAWDAVRDAAEVSDTGNVVRINATGGLIRAAPGVSVAAIGVDDLAIIAEPDAVLVCRLDAAQDVKRAVDELKARAAAGVSAPTPAQLGEMALDYGSWLKFRALPLWSTLGVSPDGIFHDVLSTSARPLDAPRRARVQPRQAYVMARAGALGWRGPWRSLAVRAMDRFHAAHGRQDGLFRTLLAQDGTALDEDGKVYDQAFVILAEASLGRMDAAAAALAALAPRALAEGYLEAGEQPYQANAHMHLLEAALAGLEAGMTDWAHLADTLVELAMTRFLDPRSNAIREFFDAAWSPIEAGDDALIEPGHQFEWAWLLERFARLRQRPDVSEIARRIYAAGRAGIDAERDVAVDKLGPNLEAVTRQARLWPQTERLKASLLLAETADAAERERLLADAARALHSLQRYLDETGLWRDQMNAAGVIQDDPAPASTFYHLIAAYDQLAVTGRRLGLAGMQDLDLA
ncbi:MAG: AGE family epimerase/isomerase [Caulobacterales bacterium]|nr:AGE family epimerase/isomerase [Caulobacterales bacterium]